MDKKIVKCVRCHQRAKQQDFDLCAICEEVIDERIAIKVDSGIPEERAIQEALSDEGLSHLLLFQ